MMPSTSSDCRWLPLPTGHSPVRKPPSAPKPRSIRSISGLPSEKVSVNTTYIIARKMGTPHTGCMATRSMRSLIAAPRPAAHPAAHFVAQAADVFVAQPGHHDVGTVGGDGGEIGGFGDRGPAGVFRQHTFEHAPVAFQQLERLPAAVRRFGQQRLEARCGGFHRGTVVDEPAPYGRERRDQRAGAGTGLAAPIGRAGQMDAAVGHFQHRSDDAVHPLVAVADGRHHRHAQPLGQAVVVDDQPALEGRVRHVQHHDQRPADLQQFGGQEQVALEVRGVHDVDDHVGLHASANSRARPVPLRRTRSGCRCRAGRRCSGAVRRGAACLPSTRRSRRGSCRPAAGRRSGC